MFQFPGLPSHRLCIHLWILKHYLKWVSSFGHLRVNGYVLLTAAFRSLSRPSSAPSAKASALCSLLLNQLRLHQAFNVGLFYCFSLMWKLLVFFSQTIWLRISNCILPSVSRKTNIFFICSLSFASSFWYYIQFSRCNFALSHNMVLHINVPPLLLALMVDLGGLEPPASRLSGVRSNQLSYRSVNS